AEKEKLLAGERPNCILRRFACDLADAAARRAVFAEIGKEATRAVVVTEGLLIYLEPAQVASLAQDLAALPALPTSITDLVSPKIGRMLRRKCGRRLLATAPFPFAPEEGPEFFRPHGWQLVESAGMLQEAARLGRLRFPLTLIVRLAGRRKRGKPAFWSGVLR